jgi:hypothetical protein
LALTGRNFDQPDRMLKGGASWPEIAVQLRDWLAERTDPIALDVVARALSHAGRPAGRKTPGTGTMPSGDR